MSSDTKVDFAKVTQMLDAGWDVRIRKNQLGSYTASACHWNTDLWQRARDGVLQAMIASGMESAAAIDLVNVDFGQRRFVDTDDFTPEQALTRLAYKIHGEVL